MRQVTPALRAAVPETQTYAPMIWSSTKIFFHIRDGLAASLAATRTGNSRGDLCLVW